MALSIGVVVTGQTAGGATKVTSSSGSTKTGSTIILGCAWDGANFGSASDSYSNGYFEVGEEFTFDTALSAKAKVLAVEGVTEGQTAGQNHNFSFTTTSASSLTIAAIEIREPSVPYLLSYSEGSIDTASPFSNSITPSAGLRVLVAFYFGNGALSAPTVSGSWTMGASIAGNTYSWGIAVAYQIVTANGTDSYTANFSDSGATSGQVFIAEYIVDVFGPLINVQPQNQIAKTGSAATFSVSALSSLGAISFQWQLNTGSGWSNISGATSSSYTTPTLTNTYDQYQYRVNITDANGTVASDSAVLDVWEYVFDGSVFDSNIFDTGLAATALSTYVKVGGVWKTATAFVKISGVWKAATPGVKVSGVWKN